jgi:hypothetical protein
MRTLKIDRRIVVPFIRRWVGPAPIRVLGIAAALAWAGMAMAFEKLPIQGDAALDRNNERRSSGVPLSNVAGTPPGSDGRAPAPGEANESGSFNDAAPGQFLPWLPFAGGVVPIDWVTKGVAPTLTGTTAIGAALRDMQLPSAARGSNVVFYARSLAAGAPYITKATPYSFGSILPIPDID